MIIDASVAVKWIVSEEDSGAALALIGGDHAAPTFMVTELGNALWKKMRKGELDPAHSFDEQLVGIGELVHLVPDNQFVPRALVLANELDHAIYDCIYLAMAEQFADNLLTADLKFLRKAHAKGFGGMVQSL